MSATQQQHYSDDQNAIQGRRIAARLAGVEGVAASAVQFADPYAGPYVGPFAGHSPTASAGQGEAHQSLADALTSGPLAVPALLDLASCLAQTLAAMHRRDVVHQNIKPGHILLSGSARAPILAGFERATTFAEQLAGFTHHRQIRGDLVYLAPEQTGRTGRTVDSRSDLYALGVTLYEAATGHPPFEAQDPLRLLHDHLIKRPIAPETLRDDLPPVFSQIVMRLLEKEPEQRYQSAEGLAYDLAQVGQAPAQGGAVPVQLGERDFPVRLSAPSRLVGRTDEVGVLRQALEDATQMRQQFVLVAGAPGVGKTSLINELGPLVTARRGWFVSGKFDQYQRDAPTATVQALRAIGRLLLAEPEAQLTSARERIVGALGINAGLLCSLPEFALLLGPQPEVPRAEPLQAEARLLATTVDFLRVISSPERPLVMVLDDLQWATPVSVRFIDALLHASDMPGFMLVGSWRDTEVDAAHPLVQALSRWRALGCSPLQMRLENLPAHELQQMLQKMMRLSTLQAAMLAQQVREHTAGNPYDTVELLNALRRDGALRPGLAGWEWDAAALRRYVGQGGVLDLLTVRIARLPQPGLRLMHVMACLGGRVSRKLLGAATGLAAEQLDEQLAAPLEDGLLMVEPGADGALGMRHDRVQQAAYGSLDSVQRRALHLELARQLEAAPAFQAIAAQQFLPACDDITQPQECRRVALLLHAMAAGAKQAANYLQAERLLAAGRLLVGRACAAGGGDDSLAATLEVDHHGALCSLGRFEEADTVYGLIEARGLPVEQWTDAACVQIDSVLSRSRSREAVTLGLSLVRQFGLAVPEDFQAANIEDRLVSLGEWIRGVDPGQDARPYTGDSRTAALSMLLNRLAYPAYLCNVRIMAWVVLEAQALWASYGPSPSLVSAQTSLGGVAISVNGDYRTGYLVSLHVLKVSESRGWEPCTSEARFLMGAHADHWFNPLEHTLAELRLAREGLLRSGELQNAAFSYRPSSSALLDCGPTLDVLSEEVEAGMALATRVRQDYVSAQMLLEARLIRSLHGSPSADDVEPNDALYALKRQEDVPAVALSIHYTRALVAAMFGDLPALTLHAQSAMAHVSSLPSYRGAQARVLRAFALARQIAIRGEPPQGLIGELDDLLNWLGQRAADAPANFLHLLKWLEAERAWALDDVRFAAASFDAALCLLDTLTRPWHHALICERYGLLQLELGMARSGRQLLAEALKLYRSWGAHAKVLDLQAGHPFLQAATLPVAGTAEKNAAAGAGDSLDLLAILHASQALSSETSLTRLRARVVDLMSALTGATSVQFALWDEHDKDWFLADGEDSTARRIAVSVAGQQGLLPLSAFRYAERTRELLLVADAKGDDRFARDPYFAGMPHCAMLVVPILNHGTLQAMLVLENRLVRSAFSTGSLEAVSMIAGQLAVSLENALIHDRLEQRVLDQTRELVASARRSGMAQIATNVLHNVGNVLNSVNVSARLLASRIRESRAQRVTDLARLLDGSGDGELARSLAASEQGRVLPGYVRSLATELGAEREELVQELERLVLSVDHIKNVVAMQLSYAGASGVLELCSITDLVEDALLLHESAFAREGICVVKDYVKTGETALDKTRLMQILVNLFENATQAMAGTQGERVLTIGVRADEAAISLRVSDKGSGIATQDLDKIFAHGFTTKSGGHGFGLHSCVVAAREMGGSLTAQSKGPGQGATFVLTLPMVASGQAGPA